MESYPKSWKERKKQVDALQKAKEFVLMHLLKAIPGSELSMTKADINLQLCKRLISTLAEIGLDLDTPLWETQATGSNVNTMAKDCLFTSQADYVSLSGFDNKDSMDWNYLDANEDADTNLF